MIDGLYLPPKPAIIIPKPRELAGAPGIVAPLGIAALRAQRYGDLRLVLPAGMIINPYVFASDASLYGALQTAGLGSNLGFVLDAGKGASYTSGQSWLDLSGGGYDFFRGATSSSSSDDPTFNGVADALTSSEYFSFDGADFLKYDSANETFMEAAHKDNANFGLVVFIYATANPGTLGPIVGDYDNGGVINGFQWQINSSGKQRITVSNGSGNALDKTVDNAMALNAWHMLGLSINEATGAGGGFFYKDGAYDQVSAADTFNSTYSSPSSSAANGAMRIGADTGNNFFLPSGTRIAAIAMLTTAPSKAQMDSVWSSMRGRFGL